MPNAKTTAPRRLTVPIRSIGGLGDGIGEVDGVPVFVPKTCAGDVVEVEVIKRGKHQIHARLASVTQRGADRIDPICAHYDQCGGCSLQHVNDASYRAFKTSVYTNALRHANCQVMGEVKFMPAATRRRVSFSVHKSSLAFHQPMSHQLVPVTECHVLSPALAAYISPINAWLKVIDNSAISRITLTHTGTVLDAVLHAIRPAPELCSSFMSAVGAHRASLEWNGGIVHQQGGEVLVDMAGTHTPLPPLSFLQPSAEGQQQLTKFVLEHTEGAARILDLFAGLGTYSLPLAARGAEVTSVELEAAMLAPLAARGIRTKPRDLFKNPLSATELSAFDAAIINPPRAGASAQTEQLAASSLRRVVMISCNPASFARDAKLLKNSGFALTAATGVDQFVWSPHLEIAAAFERV